MSEEKTTTFMDSIKPHLPIIISTGLIMIMFMAMFFYFMSKQTPVATSQIPVTSISTNGEASKPKDTQVVLIQGQSTNTKEIVYQPKELVYVTQPDGSVAAQQEKTDVEFNKKQGKVYVKVNGKEFEVPTTVVEGAKFENGKLVVTDQSEMKINITTPKPLVNLGLGWNSKNGPAIQMNGPVYKNVSWWAYGDAEKAAGGLQFPINR